MKILINAILAKRICGGSYQITQNYIRRTAGDKSNEWFYIISKDLSEDLADFFDKNNTKVYVFNNQPDFKQYWRTQKRVWAVEKEINPDIIYSIVAPSYYRFKCKKEIMRFTHPWITHPNKYLKRILGKCGGLKLFIYNAPRIFFMKKCKYFITQSETAKTGICRITKTEQKNVEVIPNTLPAFFTDIKPDKSQNIQGFHIASVAAPQKGKNLLLIPEFLYLLKTKYNIDNAFVYTTIPENNPVFIEMDGVAKKLGVEGQIKNLGYVKQSELVDLYNNCNFFFFPSIMEVFSASLLEAMYFDLAILASDLSFNSDVCKDAAEYFEPMNAESAAYNFAELVKNPNRIKEMTRLGQNYIKQYMDYNEHFDKSLLFFKKVNDER